MTCPIGWMFSLESDFPNFVVAYNYLCLRGLHNPGGGRFQLCVVWLDRYRPAHRGAESAKQYPPCVTAVPGCGTLHISTLSIRAARNAFYWMYKNGGGPPTF